ncbi:Protein of unknown function (DUF3703) [Aequorivita sublithincola DSM 14238]|uniref:DUF3703 domain-containing protein n=1 Tax=Aequorivita sublithincola (strain DSM 14238 / LMG 21431 / ACAM 643 / 9-3) TaxID=746697 RepID=I3YSZ6_AEQSU|nr:DUF3703 domain-containing protein [Aequorivita sublithincola]AFL80114.1 Protein of unknown function (DUF3703) [Aequorivita sublithincola DSM 14238]
MKFYTTLPKALSPNYKSELLKYKTEFDLGNLKSAWNHLEAAHILGQQYSYAHTFVHWKMLKFGFKIKSGKEIMGQIPRLIFGGAKSFVGKVPTGNPGGANVPPLKPFPINRNLQDIFAKAGVSKP